MADIIRVKRSDTTATPPSLAAGELAYSESSGNLFYGRIADGTPVKIGGKADVDKLALIEAGATADQTGAEVEGLLDTELGNTDWKKAVGTGAGTVAAGDHTHTLWRVAGASGPKRRHQFRRAERYASQFHRLRRLHL